MKVRSSGVVPADLRSRLEIARLDSLALFRALDRIQPGLTSAQIPQRLIRQLFELDADCAEALWALNQPPESLDFAAMVRDTLLTLKQLPDQRHRLRTLLPEHARRPLATLEADIRAALHPNDAYDGVPGGVPKIR